MKNIFLTARWENLIIISYEVDPVIIQEHIPSVLSPLKLNGSSFINLVAFDFRNTKVLGTKIPFNVNFPEINLRTYVKDNSRTGVIFIKEFVPRAIVAFAANLIYNENYSKVKMSRTFSKDNSIIKINHQLKLKKDYHIDLIAENNSYTPDEDSTEHFFKEHSWGFARDKKGNVISYMVEHPIWEVYTVIDFTINFDFGKICGKKWEFLNGSKPYNICLARGSEVRLYKPSATIQHSYE